MCQTTRDILWTPAEGWVQQANPGAGLALRVGSGQATYHRFDPRKKQHLITYGARMIAAKHQPATAQGWLSTREIRGRGYFGGEVTVLNLLAHTCCHEFAHLLQHSAGQRHYGSVHNRISMRPWTICIIAVQPTLPDGTCPGWPATSG